MSFASDYLGFPVWLFDDMGPKNYLRPGFQNYVNVDGDNASVRELQSFGVCNVLLPIELRMKTRAERWEVETHFDNMKGRVGLFWVPSYFGVIELTEAALVSAATIRFHDALELFGLKGIKRHVWDSASGTPYEIGNLIATETEGVLEASVSPVISTEIANGSHLWGLHLVRFSADSLSIGPAGDAVHDDGSEVYEVQQTAFSLLESQGNTPTGF